MELRPRLLILGDAPPALAPLLAAADVARADSARAAAEMLCSAEFDAVVSPPELFTPADGSSARDRLLLGHIDVGVALLDETGAVLWANDALGRWSPDAPLEGRPLLESLLPPGARLVPADPVAEAARTGHPVTVRLQFAADGGQAFGDLTLRPVTDPSTGEPTRLTAVVRNVTPEVEQQRKLDALHQAGRDLSGLDPSLLAEMNIPTRVELLKQNLRRSIHDLLQYDIIELRLLDRTTGELKPLLHEGMTAEASRRVLFAARGGNGVTGYVAATGQSYLCADTASDPLYIEGSEGARSSLTVPIKYHDAVVGTLNVESPRVSGFGEDDQQFTELFSKEIAAALNTLDLLTAQQTTTAAQSFEAVNREIALPIDGVLATASQLLAAAAGEPALAEGLRRILAAAREVKANVARVGREMAGGPDAPLEGKRVLVVDTDERVRRQAHLLLARLGASVESAAAAGPGIAMLADAPFDAVFLDIKPGDMGGYEAYRRLRLARPAARVALTTGFGYDSAHSVVKARQDGMQHLLFKPFRQDQVTKAVLDSSPIPPLGPAPHAAHPPSGTH